MNWNTEKLRGKIKERFSTQVAFAAAIEDLLATGPPGEEKIL